MSLFNKGRRSLMFVLVFGVAQLVIATTTRGEKVSRPDSKPTENKEGDSKKAEVLWGDKWWAAEVIEEKDGKYHIRYDGYSDSLNEWVGKDRIRFPAKVKVATPKKAEVEWNGTWYPAQVLETKDGKFFIKYDGYSEQWNEWVGKDRIRLSKNSKPASKPGKSGDKDQDEKQPNGEN